MGAAALLRHRRRRLPSLLGREVRRPVDHDRLGAHGPRSGAHSPEDRVAQHAGGVKLAVRGEAPSGVAFGVGREAPGALTLDDLIAGVWEELGVCEVVRCPACGGKMTSCGGRTASGADAPDGAAQDGAPHGDCVDCGTHLC